MTRGSPYRTALVAALVLLVISWASQTLAPGAGLDASWRASLNMAIVDELVWGRDLIFTYGPLGFLYLPDHWYAETWTLGFIYRVCAEFALLAVLWHTARRNFGWAAATILLAVLSVEILEPGPALAFAGAVWLLRPGPRSPRRVALFAVGLGAFAGFQCLQKVNYGVMAFVVGLVAVIAMQPPAELRRAKLIGLYVSAAAIAVVAFWAAARQPLGALPDYVVGGASEVSGYAATQALGTPSLNWQYPAFGIVVAVGLMAILAGSRDWPRRNRGGLAVVWLLFAYAFFKEGFIRHDLGHSMLAFAALLAALLAIPWGVGRRSRTIGLIAILLPFLVMVHSQDQGLGDLFAPGDRARAAWHDVRFLFSPTDRRALERQGRETIFHIDGVPPPVLQAVGDRSVWVIPFAEDVTWAYRLNWRPVPTFQTYYVGTGFLDSKTARFLSGSNAPERIMIGPGAPGPITMTPWQPPETVHTIMCRYKPLLLTTYWGVVARARNGCGGSRLIRSAYARAGESVAVPQLPRGAGLLYVRIRGLDLSVAEQIRAAVFKPIPRYIRVGRFGADAESPSNLLVPYAANRPIVLRASHESGYEAYAPNQRTLGVTIAKGDRRRLRFDFYSQPLRRAPPRRVNVG